jgi:hypothetical protein
MQQYERPAVSISALGELDAHAGRKRREAERDRL